MARLRPQLQQRVLAKTFGEIEAKDGSCEVVENKTVVRNLGDEPDDRFPGSFFRIPSKPSPQISWSLTK